MKRIRTVVVATMPDGRIIEGRDAQWLLTWNLDDTETPPDQRPRFHYREATEADADVDIAAGETWLRDRADRG